jgi:hypothetical protein
VSVYTHCRKGVAMQAFDALPPRLREMARQDPGLNVGFLLVALDDGMTENEVITMLKEGREWWTT